MSYKYAKLNLDMFLISDGFTKIQSHQKVIEQWKVNSQQRIAKSILKTIGVSNTRKC